MRLFCVSNKPDRLCPIRRDEPDRTSANNDDCKSQERTMDARKTAYIDGIRAKQSHTFRIDLLMGLLMCLLAVLYSGVTMFTGFIGMFPSGLMMADS